MLPETHGEICRLGYMKAVLAIKSLGYTLLKDVATKLLELAKSLGPPSTPTTGVISKSWATSLFYASLARALGILDRYRPLMIMLRGYRLIKKHLEEGYPIQHDQLLKLGLGEKLVLTYIICREDLLFLELLKWVAEKGRVKRMEAIEHGLETISRLLLAVHGGSSETSETLERLTRYARYAQELKQLDSQSKIRTRAYHAGRHLIPPRLEWAVDLNLLRRVGNRRVNYYEATSLLLETLPHLENIKNISLDASVYDAIPIFDQLIKRWATGGSPINVEEKILQVYSTLLLSNTGRQVSELTLLLAYVSHTLDYGDLITMAEAEAFMKKLKLIKIVYFKPLPTGGIAITDICDPPTLY